MKKIERMEKLDGLFFQRGREDRENACMFYACEGAGAEAYQQMGCVEDFLLDGHGNTFISNAFSLQMLPADSICTIEECLPGDVPEEAVSCIGHPDTAAVVSDILGREVECNRTSISLGDGDVLYVAQLTGGRLPEGATRLPEGFSLVFRRVTVRC